MRTWPSRSIRRGLYLAAALIILIATADASPANASSLSGLGQYDGVPTDQPLPGYTITNPPLAPAVVGGAATRVLQGTHAHAGYIVEIPPTWNGDLVMWAHGYRGQGFTLTVDPPAFSLRQRMLDQGYAWAASSYSGNGFDIRAGVLGTKDLADLFPRLAMRPHRTLIAGVSMGGYIIGRALEQYPGFFKGALPMCGVMGDQTLMDYFADYNLVAQDLAGISAYPIPLDYLTNAAPQIQARLGLVGLTPTGPDTTNDLGKQLRAVTIERSGGPRPGADAAFAVWKDFLFSNATPTRPASPDDTTAQRPGQLSTNLFTQYRPNAPVDLNRTIKRIAPENVTQRLSPFLTQVPHIDGRPQAKVLSLHGLGDLFVPFGNEQAYQADVARHRSDNLLVQRAIRTTQHCEFSALEAGTAWDDLVTWVTTGHRPAGDNVSDRAVVARADYGCRFSDQAAYAAGLGTRRLYPACPAS